MNLFRRFGVISQGSGFDKRVYLLNQEGNKFSPWHHIDLFSHSHKCIVPAVIEISRHNIAKYEMSLTEPFNPLKQDTRKNPRTGEKELRYYARFPLFNYGFLPQTWENSFENDEIHPYIGDGDPTDIVEIGLHALPIGTHLDVKVLGAMCLVDQGEADWKILTVNNNDEFAKKLNNPYDIEKVFPGRLEAMQKWFEEIKTYDGKPKNSFAGGIEGPDTAMQVIKNTFKQWKKVYSGEYKDQGYWIS